MTAPRVKLMELREYVSDRTGRTWFSGFLGSARVLVLRDDRALCTGHERGRWNVLLEESPPREPRTGSRTSGQEARRSKPAPRQPRHAAASPELDLRPTGAGGKRSRSVSAADRGAATVMRECGLDPAAAMHDDDLPF